MIAARRKIRPHLWPLIDNTSIWFCRRNFYCFIKQRLVGDHLSWLDATRSGDHRDSAGILDAGRQLGGGKAAKDHRMNGADPGTSQHGDGGGFGDCRHVDDHPVASAHPFGLQPRGESRHFVEQFGVSKGARGAGDRAVVNQRRLVTPARGHLAVEAVPCGVAFRASEPAAIDPGISIKYLVPRFDPVDLGSGLGPEVFRVFAPALIGLAVAAGHDIPPG